MKGIDIKLLRAFVTLAEQESYHRAAHLLFLTQPALSKQIKMLEDIIGRPLFFRGRHGAALTEFGSQIFPRASDLLNMNNEFFTYTQELSKQRLEKIILGFGISTYHIVPVWINTFRKKFSECKVVINELSSSVQSEMLLAGSLDIGFCRMPAANELASKTIYKEKLILAIPSSSNNEALCFRDLLSKYPLLQLTPSVWPCLAEQTKLLLVSNQLNANPVAVTDDRATLLALVAGGNGVAFLPKSVRHFLPAGIRLITPDIEPISWEIGVAWNPKIINSQRDEFLHIVEAHTGNILI